MLTLLTAQLGAPVGYKAGLTNPAVQKRFNADAPVWGVLYANMLLANGATVDAGFGARPLFEADLLVRVASRSSLQVPLALYTPTAFAELERSPEHIHTYRISNLSLWNAAAAGTPRVQKSCST